MGKKLLERYQCLNRNLTTEFGDDIEKMVIVYFQAINMINECFLYFSNQYLKLIWKIKKNKTESLRKQIPIGYMEFIV